MCMGGTGYFIFRQVCTVRYLDESIFRQACTVQCLVESVFRQAFTAQCLVESVFRQACALCYKVILDARRYYFAFGRIKNQASS